MKYKKELMKWVNGFDGWERKRSQLGIKYKAFMNPGGFEIGGYAFYCDNCWIPYAGVSLRKAERQFACDLREWRGRRNGEKDADLHFVYTGSGNRRFVSAELAEHEKEN